MVAGPLAESILGKAQEKGLLRARVMDIRDFAEGRHKVTDDTPYGGGAGMVMKPEPLVAAIEKARADFRGAAVPEALLSGDHARIARWRRRQALLRTRERRPDLFARLRLSREDQELLGENELDGSPIFREQ